MGHFSDTIPLITAHVPPLAPHVRCHPPLAIRKTYTYADGRTVRADEPCWSLRGATERFDVLTKRAIRNLAYSHIVQGSPRSAYFVGKTKSLRIEIESMTR